MNCEINYSLSASSFPLMPMWLSSQMKLIFLLYLRIKSKISVRRFGLLILLPDDIAYMENYMNRWICWICNYSAKVWRLLYAYIGWTPESASHNNRSHISPWCFAAEQDVNSAYTSTQGGYYALITFLAVTQHSTTHHLYARNRHLLATSMEFRLDQIIHLYSP